MRWWSRSIKWAQVLQYGNYPPLQEPPAPTTQIPIWVTRVSFVVLLLLDVELEDSCAFTIIVDRYNQNAHRLIIKNKNSNTLLLLSLFIAFILNEMAFQFWYLLYSKLKINNLNIFKWKIILCFSCLIRCSRSRTVVLD